MKPDLPPPSLLPIIHSCTRITSWGIMLKTTTAETNSTLWLQLTKWQATTNSSQGRGEGGDTFQDRFPYEKHHPVKVACSALIPFSPYLEFQLVRILSAQNSIQLFRGRQQHICHPKLLRDKKVKEMFSCLATKGHHTSLITRITIFWWKRI